MQSSRDKNESESATMNEAPVFESCKGYCMVLNSSRQARNLKLFNNQFVAIIIMTTYLTDDIMRLTTVYTDHVFNHHLMAYCDNEV